MKETIIDLIRHGEPVGGQRLRGTQDDPLSELGWQQMRASVSDHKPWSSIVSSPLKRCRFFAHELADRHTIPITLNDEFREIGFGDWEGLTTKALMAREPDALKRYWQDPDQHTPPNGERLSDFVSRVHAAWETLIEQSINEHKLLVCHGGVIRAILVHVLSMPNEKLWNIDVPYANVSRIVIHQWDAEGDGSGNGSSNSNSNQNRTSMLRFHQSCLM